MRQVEICHNFKEYLKWDMFCHFYLFYGLMFWLMTGDSNFTSYFGSTCFWCSKQLMELVADIVVNKMQLLGYVALEPSSWGGN